MDCTKDWEFREVLFDCSELYLFATLCELQMKLIEAQGDLTYVSLQANQDVSLYAFAYSKTRGVFGLMSIPGIVLTMLRCQSRILSAMSAFQVQAFILSTASILLPSIVFFSGGPLLQVRITPPFSWDLVKTRSLFQKQQSRAIPLTSISDWNRRVTRFSLVTRTISLTSTQLRTFTS